MSSRGGWIRRPLAEPDQYAGAAFYRPRDDTVVSVRFGAATPVVVSQGLGKVGSLGWAGDQVNGSSGAWGHGSGGGGAASRGSVEESDETDGEVSQGDHDLWCVAGAQLVAVLTRDDVSNPVEAVLHGPVPSGPGGDRFGRGVGHGRGADQVDRLRAAFAFDSAGAADPDHLGEPGKSIHSGVSTALMVRRTLRPWEPSGMEMEGTSFQGDLSSSRFRPGRHALDRKHVVGAAGDDPSGGAPPDAP